jgi:hypothetical protein
VLLMCLEDGMRGSCGGAGGEGVHDVGGVAVARNWHHRQRRWR